MTRQANWPKETQEIRDKRSISPIVVGRMPMRWYPLQCLICSSPRTAGEVIIPNTYISLLPLAVPENYDSRRLGLEVIVVGIVRLQASRTIF